MKALALIVWAALGLGCTHALGRSDGPAFENGVELIVTNNNWLDEVVYSYHAGQRIRIGTVTGLSTAVLHVPAHAIQPPNGLQLLVHPIGGFRDELTDLVTLAPGQHPELTINDGPSNVFLSVMLDR